MVALGVAGSSIVCFLVDDTQCTQWRIAATMRPVMDFAKSISKTSKVKLYPAHTLYGDAALVQRLEAYLTNYARADGWFGPLTSEVVKGLVLRFKSEGRAFLDGEPLK